jgi:putative nucleotidyltransferase with HDIG domain
VSEHGLQHAQRLATLLVGGIRGTGFYPAGHPASLHPFAEMAMAVAELHRQGGDLRIAVVDGVLSVGEHLFFAPSAPLVELARLLEQKGILGLTLKQGVMPGDLMALAALLAQQEGGAVELRDGLRAAAVATIEVKEEEPLSQTYNEAVSAIGEIFDEIGNGRIPNSRRMLTVVSSLASSAVKEPATLLGLSMIKDYDNYTFQHSVNVGVLAMALSASMGLSPHEVEMAGMSGFLHDVGKTAINVQILNKPGKLSSDEFVLMKQHPEHGADIVRRMEGVPEQVAEAVLGHHIRFDRTGYPSWAPFGVLAGIVAVTDCYDATTTLRAYQRPMQPKQAVDRLRSLSGSALDPAIVEQFLALTGRFPTGSVVRLDSNEIAVVVTPSGDETGAAVVKVVMDPLGRTLSEVEVRSLLQSGDRIVDLVDPLVRGIDVSRYL